MAHAFNSSTWDAEAGEFGASLIYRVSSRTVRTVNRETLSPKTKTKTSKLTTTTKKKMARRDDSALETLAVLPKDPGSIPITRMTAHSCL